MDAGGEVNGPINAILPENVPMIVHSLQQSTTDSTQRNDFLSLS